MAVARFTGLLYFLTYSQRSRAGLYAFARWRGLNLDFA
jgi:hypothetical protein